jgi:hypothetical protein
MAQHSRGGPSDGTVRLVRNVLALLASSALMAVVGLPIMRYEYQSGTAALVGTVVLAVWVVVAAGITLRSLDALERVATRVVAAWRG